MNFGDCNDCGEYKYLENGVCPSCALTPQSQDKQRYSISSDSETQGSEMYIGQNSITNEPVAVTFNDLPTTTVAATGDIGAGKTTTLQLLAHRLLDKNDDLAVYIIDPLESYAEFTANHGGRRIVLDDTAQLNPLVPPEHGPDADAANMHIASRFFEDALDGRLDDFDEGLLNLAIESAVSDPAHDVATVRDVIDTLYDVIETPEEYLHDEIEQTTVQEHATNVINAIEPLHANFPRRTGVDLSDSRVASLELAPDVSNDTTILHAAVINAYHHAVRHDGPAIIIMDELDYALQSDPLAHTLSRFVRHSRHYDTGFFFAGRPADETGNRRELFNNVSLRFYLHTGDTTVYDTLHERDREYVRNAATGTQDSPTQALLDVIGKRKEPVVLEPQTDDERDLTE